MTSKLTIEQFIEADPETDEEYETTIIRDDQNAIVTVIID